MTRQIGEAVAFERLHPTSGWLPVDESNARHYASVGQEIRPLIPASDLEHITRQRDEAVRLLRRWHTVDYPSDALDDITAAFLATVEDKP